MFAAIAIEEHIHRDIISILEELGAWKQIIKPSGLSPAHAMDASAHAAGAPLPECSVFLRSACFLYEIMTIHPRGQTRSQTAKPWAFISHC